MMDRIAVKIGKSGQKSYGLNPNYHHRDTKIYGHSGLDIGERWPFQIIALSRSAHGGKVASISSNQVTGAYSIVISGAYNDLDTDEGEVLPILLGFQQPRQHGQKRTGATQLRH
jgi:hypothetical protein